MAKRDFDAFLRRGGRNREWYEQLPAAQREEVDAIFERHTASASGLTGDTIQNAFRTITTRSKGQATSGLSDAQVRAAQGVLPQQRSPDSKRREDEQRAASDTAANTRPSEPWWKTIARGNPLDQPALYDAFSNSEDDMLDSQILLEPASGSRPRPRGPFLEGYSTGRGPGERVRDVLSTIAESPELVAAWQARLEAAGLIGGSSGFSYAAGVFDKQTRDALLIVFREAQQQGVAVSEALERRQVAASPEAAAAAELRVLGENDYRKQVASLHLKLWGTPPTERWIKRWTDTGLSVFEIEASERAKPAFSSSPRYQEERLSLEQRLASNLFGAI